MAATFRGKHVNGGSTAVRKGVAALSYNKRSLIDKSRTWGRCHAGLHGARHH